MALLSLVFAVSLLGWLAYAKDESPSAIGPGILVAALCTITVWASLNLFFVGTH